MKVSTRSARLFVALAAIALVLVPTAAQADPSFYEADLFGIATGPGNSLFVADAGQGIVDADTGSTLAPLPGMNDVAPIGRGEALAVGHSASGTGLYRVSNGRTAFIADTAAYEATEDPAGDGVDEGSNPFDLARLNGGKTLIADAAGNSLLVSDEKGRLDWVASFPVKIGVACSPWGPCVNGTVPFPVQPVPTSVVVGPDGAYYVGELTGFPGTPGFSNVWRIAPGSRHVRCGTDPGCTLVLDGLTSIIDLAFGPDGRLNMAQLDDASWFAMEIGLGVGGSVRACTLATGSCQIIADDVPRLTSIAYRGGTLWGAVWAVLPFEGPPNPEPQDVIPLLPTYTP